MNEKTDSDRDDDFVASAKQLFDQSVVSLDGEARSRLTRSRHAALAAAGAAGIPRGRWLPAAGVAAVAGAALVVWSGGFLVDEADLPNGVSDVEILLTQESLEMLEELEFYSWMELAGEADDVPEPPGNVG